MDDEVTLSLDLSGELLHKRGDKIMTGLAPIRENLASLILQEFNQHIKNLPPDVQIQKTLIDPMSGSGTFLIEAHDQYLQKKDRDYAFNHTPFFIENKITIEKHIQTLPLSLGQSTYQHFVGIDQSEDIIKQACLNRKDRRFILSNMPFLQENNLIQIKLLI